MGTAQLHDLDLASSVLYKLTGKTASQRDLQAPFAYVTGPKKIWPQTAFGASSVALF
jgi:hypothetical protein